MKNELIHYIRNENREPIGMVLAAKFPFEGETKIGVGWSACSPKERFNRDLAFTIAYGRARKGTNAHFPEAHRRQLKAVYDNMKDRATRYFKGATLGVWC